MSVWTQDHPRLRGKDERWGLIFVQKIGSPPLARERQAGDDALKKQARITPACAGKTQTYRADGRSCQDHPRLRGKDIV